MAKFLLLSILVLSLSSFPALTILVPENATSPERNAACEAAKYFSLLSGDSCEHALEGEGDHSRPRVHIGKTARSREVFGLRSWEELKPDEVLYRTDDVGDLWIAGEGTRGTLYALYELLEREYDCRFFTADDELIPIPKSFSLPPIGTFVRYATPFMQRTASWQTITAGPVEFKVKTRTNARIAITDEWGGNDGILLGTHTMGELIGQEHFAKHPEWFALRDGARYPGRSGQLCLSNPEVRQEMTRAVLGFLRKHKGKERIIGLSQNDNTNYCLCEKCKSFVATHGNQTDLLIDFVNEVAESVEKEFPEIYVETLAYTYTRTPPKKVRPRPNVAIRYCTAEARSFFRLLSEQNQRIADDLLAWREVAPRMLFWNYVTDFMRFYLPHPNWDTLAADIRLFRDNGAISVFEQGAYRCGHIADMGDLRAYLTSRLLWNPDFETKDLIREFCDHYYGPGSQAVQDYIEFTSEQTRLHPEAMDGMYAKDADSWLSDEALIHIWRPLYDNAVKYAGDPKYGLHLATAALPTTMTLLERTHLLTAPAGKRLPGVKGIDPAGLVAWCTATLKAADAYEHLERNGSVTPERLCENGSLTAKYWLNKMQGIYSHKVTLPDIPYTKEMPPDLPKTQYWRAWNVEEINRRPIGKSNDMCRLVEDGAAIDGKAVFMPNTHKEWEVQMTFLPCAVFDVYLTVRCVAKPGKTATGDVLSCGNYPAGTERKISAKECAGEKYKTLFVGRSNLAEAFCFYCAPVPNDTVSGVWVDRIIVTNPTDANGNPITE